MTRSTTENREVVKSSETYCPECGDIISLDLTPTKGHEQNGRTPVLVLSPHAYNLKSGLFIGAPLTRTVRGYPFESVVPTGYAVTGVVISDQVSSKSWKARGSQFICRAPDALVADVMAKVKLLLPR